MEPEDRQKQAQEAITEFLNKMTELKFPAFACVLGDKLYLEASNLDISSKYLFSLTNHFESACATASSSYEEAQELLGKSDESSWKESALLVELKVTRADDTDSTGEHLVSDPFDQPE